MYVKLRSSYDVVSLPRDPISLVNVDGDRLIFEARYLYDQEVGVRKDISNVRIEISKRLPPNVDVKDPSPEEIQNNKRRHIEALEAYRRDSVLDAVYSDPTASVANETVHKLSRGGSLRDSSAAYVRSFERVPQGTGTTVRTVEQQHAVTADERQLAERLLGLGVDPSDAYVVNGLGLTLEEAFDGSHRQSPVALSDGLSRALYSYRSVNELRPSLANAPGEAGIVGPSDARVDGLVVKRQVSRQVSASVRVSFDLRKDVPDSLYLIVYVLDVSGVTIQTLTRSFLPREHLRVRSIPLNPPIVRTSRGTTYAMVAVKQTDVNARTVRILKRVYDNQTINDATFEVVHEFSLRTVDGWKYVPLNISSGNTLVFRFVSLGENGYSGSGFASAVVRPTRRTPGPRHVTCVVSPTSSGAEVEVSNLPAECVSFRVERRDRTVHQPGRTIVGDAVQVDSPEPRHAFVLQDSGLKAGHVYAYECVLYNRSGSTTRRLTTLYQHVPLSQDLVEIKVSDPRAIDLADGIDVRFTLSSRIVSNDLSIFKSLLDANGLGDLFTDDVTQLRDKLDKLLAHSVHRVDLLTGEIENFGTVTSTNFSDASLRGSIGVSPLRAGRRYRYVVETLLRSPDTMTSTSTRTLVDSNTSRSYAFSPQKFKHPVVVRDGAIVSESSLRRNHPEDQMSFGRVGNRAVLEINTEKERAHVVGLTRQNFGDVALLRWNVTSSAGVDHFKVLMIRDGHREIVGRVSSQSDALTYSFVRREREFDRKLETAYVVVPVYVDFVSGPQAVTSGESEEFHPAEPPKSPTSSSSGGSTSTLQFVGVADRSRLTVTPGSVR